MQKWTRRQLLSRKNTENARKIGTNRQKNKAFYNKNLFFNKILEPEFDPEMDQAARKIQKHYRKKQNKKEEPARISTQEIKGIFDE